MSLRRDKVRSPGHGRYEARASRLTTGPSGSPVMCKAAHTAPVTPVMILGTTGGLMISVRILAVALLGIILGGQPLTAQSLARYRTYALESSVVSVVKSSGAREADLKTL